MIYQPEEDSYLIEREIRKRSKGKSFLEIGCGSGILMKAAIDSCAKSTLGVDIDSESIGYCIGRGLNVVKSDLFENVRGKFDLVVFNPPYLPKDEREDSESARVTSGGADGDEIILRFLKDAKNHVNKDGEILLLVSTLTPHSKLEREIARMKMKKEIVADEKVFMEVLEVWSIK